MCSLLVYCKNNARNAEYLGPSNFYFRIFETVLTFLDHFLFPPLFLYFLPSPCPLPCSPSLLLQQALKTPSVAALNQLMLCSSLCKAWKRISPGTSWQPAPWLGATFSPCLLQTQLAEVETPSATELLLLQDQEEAEAVTSLPCVYLYDCPSRTHAALLPKAMLMVLLDLENCILPLWSFIPNLLSSTASFKCMHWQHGWWMALG